VRDGVEIGEGEGRLDVEWRLAVEMELGSAEKTELEGGGLLKTAGMSWIRQISPSVLTA
jgi:hypothetical protein